MTLGLLPAGHNSGRHAVPPFFLKEIQMNQDARIKNVVLAGGIHGDELIGIHLMEMWSKDKLPVSRNAFQTHLLLGNPKAVELNKRFVDRDLNRNFDKERLHDVNNICYEDTRAREITVWTGSIQSSGETLLIDIHTTISNVGIVLVICTDDPFILRMSRFICEKEPGAKVYYWPPQNFQSSFISLCNKGISIEVGPEKRNGHDQEKISLVNRLVEEMLDYVENYQSSKVSETSEMVVYEHSGVLDFPTDEKGNVTATVHPSLKGRDFYLLQKGDAVFVDSQDKIIYYEGGDSYPMFIEETAVRKLGLAMFLTRKKVLQFA